MAATATLAVAFALTSCGVPQRVANPPAAGQSEEYDQAIRAAAVRSPDWSMPLRSLGTGSVLTVGTFTTYDLDTRNYYVWVSIPAQLWELCKGKQDAILSIQQILGLPPQPDDPQHPWHIILFQVDRSTVFRPCPGGMDPQAPPDAPRCLAGNDLDPHLDKEIAHFLLNQFWIAHHVTFESEGKTKFGYPWTGMGWTYDWDPESKAHVGVSEFVVKKGTEVNKRTVTSLTPVAFCSAPKPPGDEASSAE
ncbi:MAG: hypothetical protein ABSC95_23505 [Acetobacteraceae bacterium]|jgi:hypothetical protein